MPRRGIPLDRCLSLASSLRPTWASSWASCSTCPVTSCERLGGVDYPPHARHCAESSPPPSPASHLSVPCYDCAQQPSAETRSARPAMGTQGGRWIRDRGNPTTASSG